MLSFLSVGLSDPLSCSFATFFCVVLFGFVCHELLPSFITRVIAIFTVHGVFFSTLPSLVMFVFVVISFLGQVLCYLMLLFRHSLLFHPLQVLHRCMCGKQVLPSSDDKASPTNNNMHGHGMTC